MRTPLTAILCSVLFAAGCASSSKEPGSQCQRGSIKPSASDANCDGVVYVDGVQLLVSHREALGDDAADKVTITSSDQSVFQPELKRVDDTNIWFVTAKKAGTATIESRGLDGELLGSVALIADAPDRAELLTVPKAMLGRSPELAESSPLVLEGGRATFALRYFKGSQELFGGFALASSQSATAGVESRGDIAGYDLLDITASSTGAGQVSLTAHAGATFSFDFEAVAADAIAELALIDDGKTHDPEDTVTLVAQARTAAGRVVQGVNFDWQLEGATLEPSSENVNDGLRFKQATAGTQPVLATASFGTLSTTREVRAVEPKLVSSNNPFACSASGSQPPLLFAALFGLLLIRRRTRA